MGRTAAPARRPLCVSLELVGHRRPVKDDDTGQILDIYAKRV
jgi:hypothetical protein